MRTKATWWIHCTFLKIIVVYLERENGYRLTCPKKSCGKTQESLTNRFAKFPHVAQYRCCISTQEQRSLCHQFQDSTRSTNAEAHGYCNESSRNCQLYKWILDFTWFDRPHVSTFRTCFVFNLLGTKYPPRFYNIYKVTFLNLKKVNFAFLLRFVYATNNRDNVIGVCNKVVYTKEL